MISMKTWSFGKWSASQGESVTELEQNSGASVSHMSAKGVGVATINTWGRMV